MIDTEYLDKFESNLTEELLRLCTNYKMLNGVLLETEDIVGQWCKLAPEYMVDAIQQIKDYPTVSVAWAAYLGMAVAKGWDTDWETFQAMNYNQYYGTRGFDDMDEHILYNILAYIPEGEDTKQVENMIRRCGETSVSLIRHEHIDPQTPLAFHVFARACRSMFRIGAAIELHRLGYKFEKMYLN